MADGAARPRGEANRTASADAVLQLLYDRAEGMVARGELAAAASLRPEELGGVLADLDRRGWAMDPTPGGVRLRRPVKPSPVLIERGLGTRRVGRHVICFQEVDSTNDVAWDCAREPDADGCVVIAEHQRRGRGRLGRRWLSPPGANLLMSMHLADASGLLAHEALTIAAGLATAEGIADACGLDCRLKWPNDVLLDGAKVAGVLVEMKRRGGGGRFVVGIGVNVNAAPPPQETVHPAGCLAGRAGQPVERVEVARAVIRRLDAWVERLARQDLAPLHAGWLGRCGMLNERVTVREGARTCRGRVLDVSPLDGLVLIDDAGRTVRFAAEGATLL